MSATHDATSAADTLVADPEPAADTLVADPEPAVELESMEDLLNEPGGQMQGISRGDVIEGLVVGVDPDELLIDIGLKSEGVVPQRELWDSRSEEPKPSFSLGDIAFVYVVRPEGDGPAILSVRRAAQEKVWRATEELFENGTIIESTVQEYNKGGVLVDVGPRGFVPLSQLTSLRRGPADETEEELNAKLSELVDKVIYVKIIELDRRRNRLILSERVAEREMRAQRREILLDELQVGQVRKGMVSNICSFGAFIDLGGADGLAHISELSWSRVESPEEILRPGEEVDVYVLALDRVDKKIALSMRRATTDPWADLATRFEENQVVPGTVTKMAPFGAFVRLSDGVEGLAHSSDLGTAALHMVNEDDIGQFRILSIDVGRRRIRLTPVEIYPPEAEDYESPEVEGELAAVAESPDAEFAAEADDAELPEVEDDMAAVAEGPDAEFAAEADGAELPEVEGDMTAMAESPDAEVAAEADGAELPEAEGDMTAVAESPDATIATEPDGMDAKIEAGDETKSG